MEHEAPTQIPTEGDPAFPGDTGNDSPADPSSVKETGDGGDDPARPEGADPAEPEGDDPNKDVPFHEHPRWKQREEEWNTRFNEQETRHQEDLRKLRDEFSAKPSDPDGEGTPSWFGGTKEQWAAYQDDLNRRMDAVRKETYDKVMGKFSDEEKQTRDAEAYLNSEVEAIQSDKRLNPEGRPVDRRKLLNFVLENKLVDTEGRWNYRAGFEIMALRERSARPASPANKERKKVAAATAPDDRPEPSPKPFKTREDFARQKPW